MDNLIKVRNRLGIHESWCVFLANMKNVGLENKLTIHKCDCGAHICDVTFMPPNYHLTNCHPPMKNCICGAYMFEKEILRSQETEFFAHLQYVQNGLDENEWYFFDFYAERRKREKENSGVEPPVEVKEEVITNTFVKIVEHFAEDSDDSILHTDSSDSDSSVYLSPLSSDDEYDVL